MGGYISVREDNGQGMTCVSVLRNIITLASRTHHHPRQCAMLPSFKLTLCSHSSNISCGAYFAGLSIFPQALSYKLSASSLEKATTHNCLWHNILPFDCACSSCRSG
jgi:hypothetical protein